VGGLAAHGIETTPNLDTDHMTVYPSTRKLAAFLFRRGSSRDSPILLPLARTCGDVRVITRFCRSICPGSPLLIPDMGRLGEVTRLADRLAELAAATMRERSLSLVPVVAVGHAEGANLAAELALSHGSLLAACILLQPDARFRMLCAGALDGVQILLGRLASEEAVGTAGWHLYKALTESGAEVICERVLRHRRPGRREAAIARVFIATLFNL
jgi:pimeloyl-ACP methyl ester carboxylesterase